LLGYLAKIVDGLKVGDALMVATIKGHYTDSENLGGGCMPGCPAAHGAVAALLGKCDAVQTRSNEIAFKKSLADGVRALGKSTSKTDKSAIVETIARRTQEFPYKDKLTDLYIFSDMMENSVLLPWKKFSGMSSDQILTLMKDSGVLPDVKGANVTIIGFGRSQAAGRPGLPPDVDSKLRLVWTDILKGAGANGVTFVSANQ
jgi:hypothetical protein